MAQIEYQVSKIVKVHPPIPTIGGKLNIKLLSESDVATNSVYHEHYHTHHP